LGDFSASEEAGSRITHILKMVPPERLTSDIETRNEIISIKSRFEERNAKVQESLSKSADILLKQGKNPAHILRRCRMVIQANDTNRVQNLRQRDLDINPVDEKTAEKELEKEYSRVLALREMQKQPGKKALSPDYSHSRPSPRPVNQDEHTKSSLEPKPDKKKADLKVTFRLPPGLYEKLRKHSRDTGLDLSTVIREAVSQYLQGDAASQMSKNMEMPQAALERTGRYQVAGSDLKERLRESFLQLLAMAYVTKGCWRAEWVKKLYLGLIPLYQHLEPDDVGQDRK
jgi:predicted DNA-binding protein